MRQDFVESVLLVRETNGTTEGRSLPPPALQVSVERRRIQEPR